MAVCEAENTECLGLGVCADLILTAGPSPMALLSRSGTGMYYFGQVAWGV